MNDLVSSWLGLETGPNFGIVFSWLGLGTGHNALETGHRLVSIRWGLTLLHFLWQGALIGSAAFLAA